MEWYTLKHVPEVSMHGVLKFDNAANRTDLIGVLARYSPVSYRAAALIAYS
jgi:hypothetical protein